MPHYSQHNSHKSWQDTGSEHRLLEPSAFSNLNTSSIQICQSHRAGGYVRLWNLNSQGNRIRETSWKHSLVAGWYLTNPGYKQEAGGLIWCKQKCPQQLSLTFHSWDWTVCFSFIPENISSKTIPRLHRSTAEVHSVSLWSPACARQFCSSASGARYPSVWIYFTSYGRSNIHKKLIFQIEVLHSTLKSVHRGPSKWVTEILLLNWQKALYSQSH